MKASDQSSSSASLGTVARTLFLIRCLAEADGTMSVRELSELMELPSSTVHRLLQLLKQSGFVESEPATRTYRVGDELRRLAALIVNKRGAAVLARSVMEKVVAECQETCLFGVYLPDSRQFMYVEQVESRHALRFTIGLNEPLPVEWGSSGRVILAQLADEEVEGILAKSVPSPVTAESIADPGRFIGELHEVGDRGFDLTRGEQLADSVGIAAPVFEAGRGVIGSLTITIPSLRFDEADRDRLVALVVAAGEELSTLLGS